MAEQWGGYRRPSNPAPVSGPGRYSRRTDGQVQTDLPDADYGENASFREIQRGAPMASVAAGPDFAKMLSGLTGLGAPTQEPDVPVTSGADLGPGPGSGVLGIGGDSTERRDAAFLARHIPVLAEMAASEDTPPGFKSWFRMLWANS